jgi:hypothetical protein
MDDAEMRGFLRGVEAGFGQVRDDFAGDLAGLRQLIVQQGEQLAEATRTIAAQADTITVLRSDLAKLGAPVTITVTDRRFVMRKGDEESSTDLPTVDLEAIAALVVTRHGDQLRGEPGPPGAPCERWTPGVYRAGMRCSHFIGRVYEATCDTAAEPGDSPDWRRIGTDGLRPIGGADPREPGDLHAKEGAIFLFDGARNWLLFGKAFSAGDAEKLFRPLQKRGQELTAHVARIDSQAQAAAELAGKANANVAELARWIAAHAEAIDRMIAEG